MPQSGGSSTTLHRWHRMVRQVLHEHETALSAASPANRSRGLIKCAKESARYLEQPASRAGAVASSPSGVNPASLAPIVASLVVALRRSSPIAVPQPAAK